MTIMDEPSVAQTVRRRLPAALVGNALMRIAGGASGVLVGLYLADLGNQGLGFDAALVGALGAVSFGGELLFSVPMGMLSDAIAPRILMTAGAVLGAAATQLFGMSAWVSVLFLSRAIEGMAAAAGVPPLLAHLTDVTEGDPPLRARTMSYFELSLLAGLALGGLLGAQLWQRFHGGAFAMVAIVYLVCAAMLWIGTAGARGHGRAGAMSGLRRALRDPALRRLAPVWLCVNSIVGLWLGPAFIFLLTRKPRTSQWIPGIYTDQPDQVGWMLLTYSLVFAAGVTVWSFVLPRVPVARALRIALTAMLAVCLGLFALNHAGAQPVEVRWAIGIVTALLIMVESGFTPAALSLLAGAVGPRAGRGSAMGIYSVLLSVGAVIGSAMAAWLGDWYEVDGLLYGTLAMALCGLALLGGVEKVSHV